MSHIFRFVVRDRTTGAPNTEPYFTRGHWAADGGEWWRWALDLGRKAHPGQSFCIAYMDGPVVGGFVPDA